jgi:hypothetical protein
VSSKPGAGHNVREVLLSYENMSHLKSELEKRAYCLGHAIRQSVQEGWKVRVGTGGIPRQIFESAVSPSPSGSPPTTTDTDSDCKSEVKKK